MITKYCYEGELKKFRKYCRKHPNELDCYVYAIAAPTKNKFSKLHGTTILYVVGGNNSGVGRKFSDKTIY